MNAALPITDWLEANQGRMTREFSRLGHRLGARSGRKGKEGPVLASPEEPAAAIDVLGEIFELSSFERDILLLCAGIEMDSKLAALCAKAQGNLQRPFVTFGLALATLCQPHWSALIPSRPLRRLGLVEIEPGHGLTSAPLRIDERILHYLAGINLLPQELQASLRLSPDPVWIADEHRALALRVEEALRGEKNETPVIHLYGNDPQGQEDTAAMIARQLGRPLFVLAADNPPGAGAEAERFLRLWERESALLPGALLISFGVEGISTSARFLIERLEGLLFIGSPDPVALARPTLHFEIDRPDPLGQHRLWSRALGEKAARFNGALDEVSQHFRPSAKSIHLAGNQLAGRDGEVKPLDLWAACRSLSRPRIEHLAQRIIPRARWEDLVLPEPQLQALRQLASQVRLRMQVYEKWGFSGRSLRGLGIGALFSGESGTGKTMAAEVLADELGLDLYRVDLASMVSKYIGETEKNIKGIFHAAEEGGILLHFDECEALFNRRVDATNSLDNHSNNQLSYLLQCMESYRGLAILTTNLKGAMDQAFQRRLRITIEFPFPDARQREEIWRRVFPARTPTANLNPQRLAQLNMAGGNIRNIALNAAFFAAEEKEPVGMRHLLEATRGEARKIERPLSDAETRGWL